MKKPRILLLLDYDGTLTPIVKTPDRVRISPTTKRIIQQLSRKIIVGIVTGRAMSDIRSQVKIKNIIYAANHGLEIKLPHKKLLVYPGVRRKSRQLPKILSELKKLFSDIPEIRLENKKYSLSIHYRGTKICRKDLFQRLKKIGKKLSGWKIESGKKVVEIRPELNWDKASVVKKLRKIYRPEITIYIGDDRADENVFAVLRERDIGVVVGKKSRTLAGYSLKNSFAVKQFLEKLDKAIIIK